MSYAESLKQIKEQKRWERYKRLQWEFERIEHTLPRSPAHEREYDLFREFHLNGWIDCTGYDNGQPVYEVSEMQADENEWCESFASANGPDGLED